MEHAWIKRYILSNTFNAVQFKKNIQKDKGNRGIMGNSNGKWKRRIKILILF